MFREKECEGGSATPQDEPSPGWDGRMVCRTIDFRTLRNLF